MKKTIIFLTSFVFLFNIAAELCGDESSVVFAQSGSLDLTFDKDGKVTTDFSQTDNDGSSVTIQSDGKIIVVGKTYNGSDFDFAIARYNIDGSPDNTFDGDGKVTTDIINDFWGGGSDEALDVAIQSDGKIVVIGWTSSPDGNDYFALVRYNTNGSLDNTFSGDGMVLTYFGSQIQQGSCVAIQPNGKIVVAGYVENITTEVIDFAVARYNSNGSLDTSFDTDGKATTDFGTNRDFGKSVAIQSDGKIVVVGWSTDDLSSLIDIAIARYNTNGSLDTSFDTDGKVTTAFGTNNSYGYDVAIQLDGKIIVTGTTTGNDNLKDIALIRYNTNGSLDTSFDTDGKVTIDFGTNGTIGRSVAIQFDGKIIVVGSTYNGSDYDLITARFSSDGSLDGSFNGGGIFSTSIGSTDDRGKSVALQPNGKIIVAGYSHNGNNNDIAVVRYNNTILTLDVPIKIFLEGPFNSSISYMTATLTVPFDSPYDIAPETVNPIPPSVVDWVLVELRNKNDESEIYQSRSAFVLKLGNIVDTDGSSPVSFKLPPDDYFIVVKHRNHLGIMSSAAVTFTN